MRDWNGVRFNPESKEGHVESYFMKLNHPDGRRALWLKATILNPLDGTAVAEAWAIGFDRQGRHAAVKQVVPFGEASFSKDGMDVRVDGVRLEPRHTRGKIFANGHTIEWDLEFIGDAPALAPLPERMYDERLPTSKWVSPHPDLRFKGSYAVDGERVAVDNWPGMQGHNWGRKHAHHYAWGHCNLWEGGEELVFEGITAQVKMGPVKTPNITLLVVIDRGVRYVFNSATTIASSRGAIRARSWIFHAANKLAAVSGEMHADTEDFVGLHYENPNGEMSYCLNSKIARGKINFEVKGRPRVEARTHAAALEICTKDPGHGVRMLA